MHIMPFDPEYFIAGIYFKFISEGFYRLNSIPRRDLAFFLLTIFKLFFTPPKPSTLNPKP